MSVDPWAATKNTLSTRSVAVIPAPVRVPTQRPLLPIFTETKPRTFHLALASSCRRAYILLNDKHNTSISE